MRAALTIESELKAAPDCFHAAGPSSPNISENGSSCLSLISAEERAESIYGEACGSSAGRAGVSSTDEELEAFASSLGPLAHHSNSSRWRCDEIPFGDTNPALGEDEGLREFSAPRAKRPRLMRTLLVPSSLAESLPQVPPSCSEPLDLGDVCSNVFEAPHSFCLRFDSVRAPFRVIPPEAAAIMRSFAECIDIEAPAEGGAPASPPAPGPDDEDHKGAAPAPAPLPTPASLEAHLDVERLVRVLSDPRTTNTQLYRTPEGRRLVGALLERVGPQECAAVTSALLLALLAAPSAFSDASEAHCMAEACRNVARVLSRADEPSASSRPAERPRPLAPACQVVSLLKKARSVCKSAFGKLSEEVARCDVDLGSLSRRAGDVVASVGHYEKAQEACVELGCPMPRPSF
eukprot:tig00021339_g20444.t1